MWTKALSDIYFVRLRRPIRYDVNMVLGVTECYSPLSFVRILLKVSRIVLIALFKWKVKTSRTFRILRRCYNSPMYHTLKYFSSSSVRILFTPSNMNYHIETPISTRYLLKKKFRQSRRSSNNIRPVQVIMSVRETDIKILISRKQKCDKKLSQAKINDLKSMLHLISLIDRQYYDSLGITEQWSSFYLMTSTDSW